jgi:predicted component of type VI protein secretion system
MPAFLVPVDQGQCLIPLEKAIVLIGRQADCDVSLTLSRKISRKHCCIAQVNNSFVVRDLGSTNGVFLNGNRVQKEAVIAMGDDLVIGDVRFRLQNEATAPAKKKPAENGTAPAKAPDKPVEKKAAAPAARPLRPTIEAPPSMDIPIALPEGDLDFAVEVTNIKQKPVPRKDRIDDVIPLRDDELDEDDKPMRFASDSNLTP